MTKRIALASFFITVFLLLLLIIFGSFLDSNRERALNEEFNKLSNDINDMQLLTLISQSYNQKMVCLAFSYELKNLNSYIWELGDKIDKFRAASEEFAKSKYYLDKKKLFNQQEMIYYLLLKSMNEKCNISKEIILFFYQNAQDCKKCDDQSFILGDITNLDDKINGEDSELAVFSFDLDLNLSSINLLRDYYSLYNPPCIVYDEKAYCGIQDKKTIMTMICDKRPDLNVCKDYFK